MARRTPSFVMSGSINAFPLNVAPESSTTKLPSLGIKILVVIVWLEIKFAPAKDKLAKSLPLLIANTEVPASPSALIQIHLILHGLLLVWILFG